jgi:hypothetical protein
VRTLDFNHGSDPKSGSKSLVLVIIFTIIPEGVRWKSSKWDASIQNVELIPTGTTARQEEAEW